MEINVKKSCEAIKDLQVISLMKGQGIVNNIKIVKNNYGRK